MALRRDLAWMATSQGCFFCVQFIASVFLARLLTPYEMGIYAVALAVTAVLSVLQASGLNGFVVRQPSITPEVMASVFTINTLLSIGLAIIILGASIAGGAFLHADGVRRVMRVLAIIPLIGIFEFLPATNLERAANFKTIALAGSGKTLIAQGVSVALAFAGFSYMSIAYGQIAGALFSAIAFNLAGRQHVAFRFSLAEWRRIVTFGLQMLSISGVNSIGTRLSDVMLARIVSVSALGIYGRANSLNNLIKDNVYMVIVRVLFVELASQVRKGASLRPTYIGTIEILTAFLWPMYAGLAVIAGPFIQVVFGPRWLAAAAPLALLSLASIILTTISLSWELFVVRQETARQTRIEFLSTGLNLLWFSIGCTFGLLGAAAGRVVAAVCTVLLYHHHLNRMTDTKTSDFFAIYLRSAALTGVAIAPAALVMSLHHWAATTPLVQLALAVVLGAGLWAVLVCVFDHPLWVEFKNLKARLPGAYSRA